jgi:choline kinase
VSEVRGIVLAAGGGTRLRPLTDERPKTMLAVHGERSILELAVANLAEAGIDDVTVVTGHAAHVIEAQVPALEAAYEVAVSLRFNERFADLNNAYSLWCVRDVLQDGALLVNGDTVHPPQVERALLGAPDAPVVLATDQHKRLAEEEMKVLLDPEGAMQRISKLLDPAAAAGEYIGLARIAGSAAGALGDALRATFERRPDAYYEDGFQEFVDRGGHVATVDIGRVDWVEVDDHADLARARQVTSAWR